MKGTIFSTALRVTIVDVTHAISRHSIVQAAFVIADLWRMYPDGTAHVVVVDPGVGTDRRPIALEVDGQYFVGPDNGLFSRILDAAEGSTDWRGVVLTNPDYWRVRMSPDIPWAGHLRSAAAHLVNGTHLPHLGDPLDKPDQLTLPAYEGWRATCRGEIIYIDSFGNCVSNIPAPGSFRRRAAGRHRRRAGPDGVAFVPDVWHGGGRASPSRWSAATATSKSRYGGETRRRLWISIPARRCVSRGWPITSRAALYTVDLLGQEDAALLRGVADLLVVAVPTIYGDVTEALADVVQFAPEDLSMIARDPEGTPIGWLHAEHFRGKPQRKSNWSPSIPPAATTGRADAHDSGGRADACCRMRDDARHGGRHAGAGRSLYGVDVTEDAPRLLAEFHCHADPPAGFFLCVGYRLLGVFPDAYGPGKHDLTLARRINSE